MRTFFSMKTKWTGAALLMVALFAATTAISLAAPASPRTVTKAHSDAWHEFYLDQNNAERVTSNVAETAREKWRGGLAEQRGLTSITAPHKALRGAAHGEERDSVYFARTIGKSSKTGGIDYQNPLTWEGCHAQDDHKVQFRSDFAVAVH